MVRIGLSFCLVLTLAANAAAQEPTSPIEPLGAIASAGAIDLVVEQKNLLLSESGGTARKNFLALSPGIADGKGSFTSTVVGGYIYSADKGGVEAIVTYANIGIETGSVSRDLFAFRGKAKYAAHERVNVAGVIDQRHLQDSYDRTKVLFAGDARLTEATSSVKVTAVVNAGVVRNAPLTGDDVSDSAFGVGVIAGFSKLGKLTIGVDYRPRNDVEGAETVSGTFRHAVGAGTLQYSVDKKGSISVSYLTLF